jgi:methylmalonyl-CoA/ethylmalonyl-CoA epimerase
MFLEKIDHIGIAVSDLDEAIAYFESRYGARVESREEIPSDKVEEAMIRVGESYIQLLAPTAEDSPVAKFMAKWGPGMHHLGFGVTDLERVLDHLRAQGAQLVDQKPRIGGGGKLVAFVHPKDGLGVLVELVQSMDGSQPLSSDAEEASQA